MARGGRRNYVRDASGRFASTPGGGASGLGAARKAGSPGARRKAGAMAGGTLAARSSLKASRAKAAASFTPSPQQRGAITRASRKLTAAQEQSRRTGLNASISVIRGKAGKQAKKLAQKERSQAGVAAMTAAKKSKTAGSILKAYDKGAKQRGAKMLRDFQASGKQKPASQAKPKKANSKISSSKPSESKSTRKNDTASNRKTKPNITTDRRSRAQKIKEMVNRTGIVKGKNFKDGKDVSTLSMAQMRKEVRQMFRKAGVETRKDFKFIAQEEPPKTRSGWERLYKRFVTLPQSEQNRKDRPGIINGIDIQKNFRPWAVFGLNPRTATTADIQSAFRRVAKQVHPDMGGRPRDLARIKKMRDSILAMREADPSPRTRKAGAKSTSTANSASVRPRGPLLLMPAKSTPKPKRQRSGKT